MAQTYDDEQAIFESARKIASPTSRNAYLQQVCGDDIAMRDRVAALLQAYESSESFLELPPAELSVDALQTSDFSGVQERLVEGPGIEIGPYKLLQQIGEGGMGVVFMAEQTHPVQRTVALKIIKPGMDTRQVIARFEAERQALAMMDHPNIARVVDAGMTDTDRPYFVMDLVKGVPITDYCDQQHLSIRERLELFTQVCHAVQHAHQKGVIHRDIKPSNVLVAEYDGRPVPKVIDFGVAKATAQKLTERTMFTEYGQLIGTFEYMSPEQARFNQLDVDTRSDIYSLGVLLYELLTGSTPFEQKRLREAAFDDILRIIREEEPPRPSTRLGSSDTLPSIAANRQTEPARLNKEVHGELDWIAMKALEKNRNRRYETANELALDIQRHLNDEPVQARPQSTAYRFLKFARRNRVPLVAAGAVAGALLLGTVLSTWQAIRATHARNDADTARMDEAAQRAIADRRRIEADQQRAEAQRLSQIAEKARQQAEASLQKAREAGHEFFTIVSESRILDEPGVQTLREELMKAAVSYYGSLEDADSTDPKVLADVAVSQLRLAQIQIQGGLRKEPFATLERGLKLTERLIREHPRAAEEHLRLAGFWHGGRSVRTQWVFDDPAFGIQVLRQAANIWEGLAERYPTATGFRSDLSKFYSVQGTLRSQMGDQEAALLLKRRAAEIRTQIVTENPGIYEHVAELANIYHALALSVEASDVNEAEAFHRKAIELQKVAPDVATYQEFFARHLHQFGTFLRRRNRPHEAIQALEESIRVYERLTKKYPHVNYYLRDSLQVKVVLAELFLAEGRSEEAKLTFAQASDEIQNSDLHHENARMWLSIANTACELEQWDAALANYAKAIEKDPTTFDHISEQLRAKKKLPEAEKLLRQALAAFEKRAADSPSEPTHQADIASVLNRLGWVLRLSQPQEAEKLHRRAIDILEKLVGSGPTDLTFHESLGFSYRFLVFQLDPTTKAQEREEVLRQAAAQLEKTLAGAPDRQYCRFVLVDTYRCLADDLVAQQRTAEAEELYRKALDVVGSLTTSPLVGSPDEVPRRQAVNRCFTNLIQLLMAAGRTAEAEQVEQQAITLYEKLATERPDKPYFREVLTTHQAALAKLKE